MKKILCTLVACCCTAFAWGSDTESITFPAYSNDIVDEVNLLDASARTQIQNYINQLENFKLAVVVLKDTRGLTIEQYGYQLGRKWGVGDAKTDNGVLFIVVPSARKVRIEVGYGAEGVLTDARSGIILDNYVIPHFKRGNLPGGIISGTRAIVNHLNGRGAQIERTTVSTNRIDSAQIGAADITELLNFLTLLLYILFGICFQNYISIIKQERFLLSLIVGIFFMLGIFLLSAFLVVFMYNASTLWQVIKGHILLLIIYYLGGVLIVALLVKFARLRSSGRSGGFGGGGFRGGGGGSFGGGGASRGW